jgi:hypothetical protein
MACSLDSDGDDFNCRPDLARGLDMEAIVEARARWHARFAAVIDHQPR